MTVLLLSTEHVASLASAYMIEMRRRPTEITRSQFASLYAYTNSVEQVGKLVGIVAADMRLDLQM